MKDEKGEGWELKNAVTLVVITDVKENTQLSRGPLECVRKDSRHWPHLWETLLSTESECQFCLSTQCQRLNIFQPFMLSTF